MATHVVTGGSSEYVIPEIFELLQSVFVNWLLCRRLARIKMVLVNLLLAMEAAKHKIAGLLTTRLSVGITCIPPCANS